MGIEDVIISFLRKEPLCRGNIRSNGFKLFAEDTCIGQWKDHRVVMNDTEYDATIKRFQEALYKWLQKSDIIFRLVTGVPRKSQQILSYYGED